MCPVRLDNGALRAVADLLLIRPHRAGQVFGYHNLFQGHLGVLRGLDAIHLVQVELEPVRHVPGRGEHGLPVGPDEHDEEKVVENEEEGAGPGGLDGGKAQPVGEREDVGMLLAKDSRTLPDDVGVVGPADDGGDEEDRDPLGHLDAAAEDAASAVHLARAHLVRYGRVSSRLCSLTSCPLLPVIN